MCFIRFIKNRSKQIAFLCLFFVALYGASRLYYRITGGFTIGNISSEIPYSPRWDIAALTLEETAVVDSALAQKFKYLGKGCQSYVFLSEDGHYILKFFKYQRFRPQAWLDYLTFIPGVDAYRLGKIEKKRQKLDNVFSSWKLAFEELQPETQLLFVHLNKSTNLNRTLLIEDKMGIEHRLEADDFEFLVQRKATLLCPYIKDLMAKGNRAEAQQLLNRIIALIVFEYQRGYADNDHALMQNTGVYDGYPIHIDVGQFEKNPQLQNPELYHQELFNKTYKFRIWLEKHYPELAHYLQTQLRSVIGEAFLQMQPTLKRGLG